MNGTAPPATAGRALWIPRPEEFHLSREGHNEAAELDIVAAQIEARWGEGSPRGIPVSDVMFAFEVDRKHLQWGVGDLW